MAAPPPIDNPNAQAAPGWFAPAMAAALEPVHNRLDNIDARLGNIENRLDNMVARSDKSHIRLQNIEARQKNAVLNKSLDLLQPLMNENGVAFPHSPSNLKELHSMTGPRMTEFLDHYGLRSNGPNIAKRHRIQKFIGRRAS